MSRKTPHALACLHSACRDSLLERRSIWNQPPPWLLPGMAPAPFFSPNSVRLLRFRFDTIHLHANLRSRLVMFCLFHRNMRALALCRHRPVPPWTSSLFGFSDSPLECRLDNAHGRIVFVSHGLPICLQSLSTSRCCDAVATGSCRPGIGLSHCFLDQASHWRILFDHVAGFLRQYRSHSYRIEASSMKTPFLCIAS